MLREIKQHIVDALQDVGVQGSIEILIPPNSQMGDLSFGCFIHAKEVQSNPAEAAQSLAAKLQDRNIPFVQSVETVGPYVNFFLQGTALAQVAFERIGNDYGVWNKGEGKRYLVEYACPNPMKAFHLGHLRNLVTGESVCRVLENVGYDVVRVNYQGDVGMHIAKSLYGIYAHIDEFHGMSEKSLRERVEFLGRCYAFGAQAFEEDEEKKQEVITYNDKVYENSDDIVEVYTIARRWSLEYFATIYDRLGSKFDHLYFESETFASGVEIVKENLEKGIFKESEGAIIYEGSKHGLHDRVFINSKGFPTYEAKDIALSKMRFDEYAPDKIIHVVGKEQTEYFKVIIKALEEIYPDNAGKEYHLIGGYLQLKGDQKMSSRKGNIVTGDQLLDNVALEVETVMHEYDGDDKQDVLRAVTGAALKYSMLRAHVSQDMAFDVQSSVTISGDSGPYLQYIVARIKSMLRKAQIGNTAGVVVPESIAAEEKALLMKLAQFPEVTHKAAQTLDPSAIAHYAFDLAQLFNSFYHVCPVLQEDKQLQSFRIALIEKVLLVMERSLNLLGIETVEKM